MQSSKAHTMRHLAVRIYTTVLEASAQGRAAWAWEGNSWRGERLGTSQGTVPRGGVTAAMRDALAEAVVQGVCWTSPFGVLTICVPVHLAGLAELPSTLPVRPAVVLTEATMRRPTVRVRRFAVSAYFARWGELPDGGAHGSPWWGDPRNKGKCWELFGDGKALAAESITESSAQDEDVPPARHSGIEDQAAVLISAPGDLALLHDAIITAMDEQGLSSEALARMTRLRPDRLDAFLDNRLGVEDVSLGDLTRLAAGLDRRLTFSLE